MSDGTKHSGRITPVATAVVIGILAVAVQLLFDKPEAYGICVACHSRDMLGWIINNLLSADAIVITQAGVLSPFLTPLGILIGAHIAARRYNVFPRPVFGGEVKMFLLGILSMVFALILAACPLRLLLRIAYGDPLAIFGGLWMVGGIAVGIFVTRRWFI
ncbi:Uncharacterised protein [uncultured archaeon]|nr:Uncharacterised protein [uncultured archaeon]